MTPLQVLHQAGIVFFSRQGSARLTSEENSTLSPAPAIPPLARGFIKTE
jgi:hypothetical protein